MNNFGYYPYFQNGNGVSQNQYQRNSQPMNYQQPMMNPQMQQGQKIDRVNGREGADAYFLMPNSEALLLDTKDPIVWLKQTDSAGYGTVTGFTIMPLKENANNEQYDFSSLERRVTEIEQLLEGMTYGQSEQQNVQPPTTANVQPQPNTANTRPRHTSK